MTIIEKAPCLLSLSTHGGAVLDVGFAEIVSCLGGWAFQLKTDSASRTDLYENIVRAYIAAIKEFDKTFTLPPESGRSGLVDQW